ncbi:MAG: hypothetical protein WA823_01050 [Candidatus Acidiferrales bacterium]
MACARGFRMLNALRYYWVVAKGYRLRPWASPYLQWRFETYFGKDAAHLDRAGFLRLMWNERERMRRFLEWVAEQRERQQVI